MPWGYNYKAADQIFSAEDFGLGLRCLTESAFIDRHEKSLIDAYYIYCYGIFEGLGDEEFKSNYEKCAEIRKMVLPDFPDSFIGDVELTSIRGLVLKDYEVRGILRAKAYVDSCLNGALFLPLDYEGFINAVLCNSLYGVDAFKSLYNLNDNARTYLWDVFTDREYDSDPSRIDKNLYTEEEYKFLLDALEFSEDDYYPASMEFKSKNLKFISVNKQNKEDLMHAIYAHRTELKDIDLNDNDECYGSHCVERDMCDPGNLSLVIYNDSDDLIGYLRVDFNYISFHIFNEHANDEAALEIISSVTHELSDGNAEIYFRTLKRGTLKKKTIKLAKGYSLSIENKYNGIFSCLKEIGWERGEPTWFNEDATDFKYI